MKKKNYVFSLLALFLIVLAGCGQGGSTTSKSTSSVLTIVPSPKGDFTNGFSPYSSSSNYGSQGMIYETLLFFNRMNSEVKPWLAQSYNFSSDAKTLTLHLLPNVNLPNGHPFPPSAI